MIPTSGFNLQELALAKEDARIRARRERDEERRHRFLNARTRIMGLDAAALDEQVQEMRRSREDAKESDRLEKLRMIQISNMLEQAHEEEKNMRRQQLEELKKSWESEIEAKRARAPEPYMLDLEQCGPASAQNFGNDEEKDDRKSRIQKEEMRTWVKDALIEKKHRSVAEREEDMRYAALLQALDGYREVKRALWCGARLCVCGYFPGLLHVLTCPATSFFCTLPWQLCVCVFACVPRRRRPRRRRWRRS
jgi:hypothetical protein